MARSDAKSSPTLHANSTVASPLPQVRAAAASPKLKNYSNLNTVDAEDITESNKWSSTRKKMRKTQHEVSTQQRY